MQNSNNTRKENDNETTESIKNFDCYTMIQQSCNPSWTSLAFYKYCYKNKLSVFEYQKKLHWLNCVWNFESSNNKYESRLIFHKANKSQQRKFFSNKPCLCADAMLHPEVLKVASIQIFNKYCRNKSKRNIKESQYRKLKTKRLQMKIQI